MSINAPVIQNPVMLDRVIGEIQTGLVENLPWLDVAFGRSQRLTKMMNGKKIITPNVYCGGWNGHGENDYIEVSPDSKIGNFSFFEIEDPQTIDAGPWARSIKAPFSLIVWFDLTRIYNEPSNRNTEYIKAQILHVLNGRAGWHLTQGRVTINRVYERAENVYRGYTLPEIDNQFLMHPFAGFRFDGILMFDELCITDIAPIPELKTMLIDWELGQEFATAKIKRIIGRSEIIDGVLRNNMTSTLETTGTNLFDRSVIMNGTWYFGGESGLDYDSHDEQHVCSAEMWPKPGQRLYVHAPGLDGHIKIMAIGPNDTGEYDQFPDGILDFTGYDYERMVIVVDKDFAELFKGVCVNISDPLLDGRCYDFWNNTLHLSITSIQGRNNGVLRNMFWEGLKSCGNIFDEISGNRAIQRVGYRVYLPGDENNDAVMTDGRNTVYVLSEPIEWEILPIADSFPIAVNGSIVRFPRLNNTDLMIEYYVD